MGKKTEKPRFRFLNSQDTLHGCWINQDWNSSGVTYIIVSRKIKTGLLTLAFFYLQTIKKIVLKSWALANVSQERFSEGILKQEGVEFFNIELDLVKKLLADVVQCSQKAGNEFPEDFFDCLRIVGPLDFAKEKKITPEEKEGNNIVYHLVDGERADAELRQLSCLEEAEDSDVGHRHFFWLGEKGDKKPWASVVLEGSTLTLEVYREQKRKDLQNFLAQSLGTNLDY